MVADIVTVFLNSFWGGTCFMFFSGQSLPARSSADFNKSAHFCSVHGITNICTTA